MPRPEPLEVPWRGRSLRVRHDDPVLRPYGPMASVIGAAVGLARDADGLRSVLAAVVGDRYEVAVRERDGEVEVGLRRRR